MSITCQDEIRHTLRFQRSLPVDLRIAPAIAASCQVRGRSHQLAFRSTSSTASGCFAITARSTRVGASGRDRPCSQLRRVAGGKPNLVANCAWLSPIFVRTFRTSTSGTCTSVTRTLEFSPRDQAIAGSRPWTNHEIFVLLVKRIETYFGRGILENELLETTQRLLAARYLKPIIEPVFTGVGLWENAPMYRVLMSLIRKRPRDLVNPSAIPNICSALHSPLWELFRPVVSHYRPMLVRGNRFAYSMRNAGHQVHPPGATCRQIAAHQFRPVAP